MTGNFDNVNQLLGTIKGWTTQIFVSRNQEYWKIRNNFCKNEGISFPGEEIPSIVGFTGIPDGRGVHNGYKMGTVTSNKVMKSDETKAYSGEFPADLCAGKQLKFFYTNISEYQYLGDATTPLLRVIDSKRRLKNGSVYKFEPTPNSFFSNLDYKKLLSNTIQSISIELRAET